MFYNENDPRSLEIYSSAVTLSDMEVFIFPELMFSLVLANAMSPRLWKWQNDPWFKGYEKGNNQRRIQRLKQFIMDHFAFNLDLDTWGLTTKEKELKRFSAFINEEILADSNALFGYEGDKYYFDIDIRKHFGLDKYTSSTIPYWKTETLEAMEAFAFKDGYSTGAGECVSLAALYASSAFVVGKIPIESIYMYATPLHSQNYLDIGDGIITNNRRIVTKNMWFNGTELSAKARRAIDNEKVTIVADYTGYIHTMYPIATINPDRYKHFRDKLRNYLKTDIDFGILANFLRQNPKIQGCFQIAHSCCGKARYIEAEKVFHYEHSSKSRVGDTTQNALLHEIEEDEFYTEPLPYRLMLSELEMFFKQNRVLVDDDNTLDKLKQSLHHGCLNVEEVIKDLRKFCRTNPRLPSTDKEWKSVPAIDISKVKSDDELIAYVESIRKENITADLAFTAFRDLSRSAWKPFLKAAIERNPVSLEGSKNLDFDKAYEKLNALENESIYDSAFRMAQPDEVWNFKRGDGLEKAICLINIIKNRNPENEITLTGDGKSVCVKNSETKKEYKFSTSKKLTLPDVKDFQFS